MTKYRWRLVNVVQLFLIHTYDTLPMAVDNMPTMSFKTVRCQDTGVCCVIGCDENGGFAMREVCNVVWLGRVEMFVRSVCFGVCMCFGGAAFI
jgi:hypothetical protein